ncbi:DUF4434 domain-containing protein [Nonomuraea sp. NPDC003707]
MRRVLAVLSLVMSLLAVAGPAGAATCTATPRFAGSFLQPGLGDTWTSATWDQELGYLTRACMSQLVLQWTADSKAGTAVYPSALYGQSTTTDVVGAALSTADRAGMTVYLGLQVNDDWWNTYANDPAWLDNEATIANNLADDLWAKYRTHASLAGWYLSFEVDNWNFTTTASQNAMAAFYKKVADHLHALSPGKPVVISPFFNTAGGLTTAQWQSMWTTILATSPIDVIALQDGVGAGHATAGQLAAWFAATKNAITAARPATQLWADSETFNLDFQPMPIKGVVDDLQAVQPYVSSYWSFSYDHYQSPLQVAPIYDRTYRDYLATGSVESTAPTAPSGLTATATDPLTVTLSWSAATDAVGIAGYRITRNGTPVKTLYGTATTFTDAGLDPSTAYTYTLRAFDAAGNQSAASGSASATTPAAPSNPVNLAAGRPYTVSLAASPSYPDGGGELTDGAYGAASYGDAAWQGRNTGATYSITVDLGAQKTIKELRSDWLQTKSVYIFLPKKVTYEVSANGSSYTAAGSVAAPAAGDADQARTYRLLGLNTTARYVRITVEPAGSAWSFTDEVEVRTT